MKTRARKDGFTLIEVLIAMAIVGITAVVLLDQRMQIVQDAGRARDMRTCWILASQKMAELELDKTLWVGLGSSSNGDFGDVDPDYGLFTWEYQILREEIETRAQTDATAPKDENKKRELFRLTMTVRAPGIEDPIILEAEFPVLPPKPPPTTDPSKDGAPPTSTGTTPPTGGSTDGALRK